MSVLAKLICVSDERNHHKVGLVVSRLVFRLITVAIILSHSYQAQGAITMWKKPSFTELRLGFEVTLYISNR